MSENPSEIDPLGPIAESFLARLRDGGRPSVEECARAHPELADRIRAVLPALVEIEQFGPMSGESAAAAPDAVGRIGDYRLIREVGRGGMGIVYEAVQEALGRHVAVKVMAPVVRGGRRRLERFRLEARSAARLQHAHIVPVHGVGEHGGWPYYVMQFIPGRGLEEVLEGVRRLRAAVAAEPGGDERATDPLTMHIARGLTTGRVAAEADETPDRPPPTVGPSAEAAAPVEPEGAGTPTGPDGSDLSGQPESQYFRTVARIGQQAAGALAYAHEQGVLHRDIKPSNLLLDVRGSVWVTDFGLAKVNEGEGLTESGDILGTLRYMAPERFEGWSDPRSDVYSLGVTLYELLTLRSAFPHASRAELIDRVVNDLPRPPRKIDPRIPRDLETIVLKAIAKEPGDRYASAAAMADDLRLFLEDRTIRARRSPAAERAWRWCRRNPALAAATAAAAVLLVVVAVGGATAAGILKRERDEARRQKAVAQEKETIAEAERDKAMAAHEAGRHLLYAAQMHLAHRAWREGAIRRVRELLDDPSYAATGPGQADLRGWEWGYLRGLCHQDLATLSTRGARIEKIAYSPDGRRLAAAVTDGATILWDLDRDADRRGRLLRWFSGPSGAMSVAFSPDGRVLATALNVGLVEIWDAAEGRPLHRIVVVPWVGNDTETIRAVAFSPDGRLLAAAGWDRLIHLYDAHDWREVRTFRGHEGKITSAAFSPDGRTLASSGLDRTARLWDVATGRPIRTLKGHERRVSGLAFSPDGATLATSGEDETIRIWDPATGAERMILNGHAAWDNQVAFHPDGRTLASAGTDGMVLIWDAASGRERRILRGHAVAVLSVAFRPDGRVLASADDRGEVKLWDLVAGPRDERSLRAGREPIVDLGFRPDGRTLVAASRDGTATLLDATGGREPLALAGHTGEVWGAAFRPDGRVVATGGFDRAVRLWDADDGRPLRALRGHAERVRCVAFSPDSRALASGDMGGTVRTWDGGDGRPLRTLVGHDGPVERLAFGPDGRRLASSGHDGTVRIWDADAGRPLATLRGHRGEAWGLAFHPDGRRLASGGEDGTVRIWAAGDGRALRILRGHSGSILGLAFDPGGRRLASCGSDRTVRIWDADAGLEVLSLKGTGPLIYDVAFSPDGTRLAASNSDGTITLWDAGPAGGGGDPPAAPPP